jgi:hypothetical protein
MQASCDELVSSLIGDIPVPAFQKKMLFCSVEQVAVVLRSNELLDQAKQVLDESRQATEVKYSAVVQYPAVKGFL